MPQDQSEGNNGTIGAIPTATSLYCSESTLDWVESKPGIFNKLLYENSQRGERTMLTRMQPGARSAPHTHDDYEQIHVIEGSLHDGERELQAGDHCCRSPGAVHTAHTRDGALVLVIYTPA